MRATSASTTPRRRVLPPGRKAGRVRLAEGKLVADETDKWGKVVKFAGIQGRLSCAHLNIPQGSVLRVDDTLLQCTIFFGSATGLGPRTDDEVCPPRWQLSPGADIAPAFQADTQRV